MAEFVEFLLLLPLNMVFFCMNFENYPISVHCFLSAQCNAQFIELMISIKLRWNITQKFTIVAFNPLNANPKKWSNTLKRFVASFPTNCLSVFDHFVGLALKGLRFTSLKSRW